MPGKEVEYEPPHGYRNALECEMAYICSRYLERKRKYYGTQWTPEGEIQVENDHAGELIWSIPDLFPDSDGDEVDSNVDSDHECDQPGLFPDSEDDGMDANISWAIPGSKSPS